MNVALPADDTIYQEAVETAVIKVDPSRVEVTRTKEWIYFTSRDGLLASQGWKVHLSVVTRLAAKLIDVVVPHLLQRGVSFKISSSLKVTRQLNHGEGGLTQIGKLVTVYPSSDAEIGRAHV